MSSSVTVSAIVDTVTPGSASLSVTVTATPAIVMPWYSLSVLAALWVSETDSSAVSASSPAVTVTVWAVPQFVGVKVRVAEDGVRVTSVPACPATVTVTFAVGWLLRTTV